MVFIPANQLLQIECREHHLSSGEKFLATNEAMSRFYINRYSGDELTGLSLTEICDYYENGYRYVVIDRMRANRPAPAIDELVNNYQPVKVVSNDMVTRLCVYYDFFGYIMWKFDEVRKIKGLDKILIYDLKEIFSPDKGE